MSNHDIGRGLNEITRLTISMFDSGEISRDAAKKIIATCGMAVYWDDGNPDEAVDCIRKCRCGNCLRLVPENEPLYSLWNIGYLDPLRNKLRPEKIGLALDGVCEDCLRKIVDKYSNGEYTLDDVKESIYSCDNTSEGSPHTHNNGYKWARDVDWFKPFGEADVCTRK